MILFNFSKNAVIFKTFYTYQNTNVCSEIPFCKNLYHIEISQLFCSTTQVTGFYMRRSFTERLFQRDLNKQTKIKKKYLGKYIKVIVLKMCSKLVLNTILT